MNNPIESEANPAGLNHNRILKAEFDPRLKNYILIITTCTLILTVIGIVLIPFWLIFGRRYLNRYFDALHCELTKRSLQFKKGIFFTTERTIPLDKIQDLTFKEGPVLRYFGLSTLKVETAGQSAQSNSDLSLTGIVQANEFRTRVLQERDRVTENRPGESETESGSNPEMILLLREIRDKLHSIDTRLGR
ncbi:MAG: PH domain-containing protein [Balneolaceae bacterium]